MQVLTWDGQLLALELPQTVDLEIIETAPKSMGLSAMDLTISSVTIPGADAPINTSAPFIASARVPLTSSVFVISAI